MKVQTKTSTEVNNIISAVAIERFKKIRLDENKTYRVKIAINESAIGVVPTVKKVKAKLEQQTNWFFAFSVKTKSGDCRIEIISKFDYLKNPSLIEVLK